MDTDLRCNFLKCRRNLADKAVVTTCSHIFCVECANELFNTARLCPACETTLSERDDVVVCSLNPTNDYKTSVLSGLSPSIILEICSRAISFWQYQIHQENTFQQAVVRNVNDRIAQLQKQVENVVREASGEINLLSSKIGELDRDLELERRKVRELQDALREREKEYQKQKSQLDKIKRKALLGATHPVSHEGSLSFGGPVNHNVGRQEDQHPNLRTFGVNQANVVNLGAVVGGMEANGIQRTPIVNRTVGSFISQHNSAWAQQPLPVQQVQPQARTNKANRRTFSTSDHHRAGTVSDRSGSASEVENLLMPNRSASRTNDQGGWVTGPKTRPTERVFAPPPSKRGFRPAR